MLSVFSVLWSASPWGYGSMGGALLGHQHSVVGTLSQVRSTSPHHPAWLPVRGFVRALPVLCVRRVRWCVLWVRLQASCSCGSQYILLGVTIALSSFSAYRAVVAYSWVGEHMCSQLLRSLFASPSGLVRNCFRLELTCLGSCFAAECPSVLEEKSGYKSFGCIAFSLLTEVMF